jgi:magnesium-protoporphyrin IX monomethyl ester (oxidative) cyclase
MEWCNDEFSHGEAYALLMRSDPKRTTGINEHWIRFFLVAVFGTMSVRDHARPAFHKALGVDIDWYDREVFRITSEIARQVFPMAIDIDNPAWDRGLKRLGRAFTDLDAAKRKGGLSGSLGKATAGLRAGLAFARLYLIPVKPNTAPISSRLQPTY